MRRSEPVAADPTDRALLAAMAAGDRDALGAFYDRHAALALGLARAVLRDRAAAEDAVAAAFVAAWRRAPAHAPAVGEPRLWLLGLVLRAARARHPTAPASPDRAPRRVHEDG